MDSERLKRAGGTAFAILVFVSAIAGFQEDAGGDISDAWDTASEKPVAALLLLGGLVLMGFIWRNEVLSFFGLRLTNSVKDRLQGLALRNGYTVRDRPNSSNHDFQFLIRDAQDRPIIVLKPKEQESLLLVTIVQLQPELVDFLKEAQGLGVEVMVHMRIAMARSGVRYVGLNMPDDLDTVQLQTRMPLEVSSYEFIEGLHAMTNAVVNFNETLLAEQIRVLMLQGLVVAADAAASEGEAVAVEVSDSDKASLGHD